MELVVTGRILKRHHYSKNMIFYDVVLSQPPRTVDTQPPAEEIFSTQYSIISISVQRTGSTDPFPKAVVGDVIVARGIVHNETKYIENLERMSLDVRIDNIDVIEPWVAAKDCHFLFEKTKLTAEFQSSSRVDLNMPVFAIQVTIKQLERVKQTLQELFGSFFDVRESCTGYVNSNDRLLMLSVQPSLDVAASSSSLTADRRHEINTAYWSTVQQIIRDPTLAPSILRIYSGHCSLPSSPSLTFVASELQTILNRLVAFAQEQDEMGSNGEIERRIKYRLHTYPSQISKQLIALDTTQSLPLHTSQHSHVVSVFLCDGVWSVSVLPASQAFIGDLREKKATMSSGKGGRADPVIEIPSSAVAAVTNENESSNSNGLVTICRAGAKIAEIMRRLGWLYEASHSTDSVPVVIATELPRYRYQLAFDVGASPGGWTYFLATQADVAKVIAIDKGDLLLPLPWPTAVEHWRMTGEEAADKLGALHEDEADSIIRKQQIDLYCCDANITPASTVSILLRFVERNLVAARARVVLTFKNPFGKQPLVWQQAVADALQRLQDAHFDEISQRHLLANTAKETTITCVYSPNIA